MYELVYGNVLSVDDRLTEENTQQLVRVRQYSVVTFVIFCHYISLRVIVSSVSFGKSEKFGVLSKKDQETGIQRGFAVVMVAALLQCMYTRHTVGII